MQAYLITVLAISGTIATQVDARLKALGNKVGSFDIDTIGLTHPHGITCIVEYSNNTAVTVQNISSLTFFNQSYGSWDGPDPEFHYAIPPKWNLKISLSTVRELICTGDMGMTCVCIAKCNGWCEAYPGFNTTWGANFTSIPFDDVQKFKAIIANSGSSANVEFTGTNIMTGTNIKTPPNLYEVDCWPA